MVCCYLTMLFLSSLVFRADVSTSLAVFVGLLGSMAGYPLLDPLAGLLVAGLIVRQVRTRNVLCAWMGELWNQLA